MSETTVDAIVKSIHRLAMLRHPGANAHDVAVVIRPEQASCGANLPGNAVEPADMCRWEAQVKYGPGRWWMVVALEDTPEKALASLLRASREHHQSVDERRARAMDRVSADVK